MEIKQHDLLSASAFGLISRLLVKDPQARLGSHAADLDRIKEMQFFDGIDWNSVKNKSLKVKLDFVLEVEEMTAGEGKRCRVEEFEEIEEEEAMEEVNIADPEQLEEDCSKTSLWLEGFTQGALTQQTASFVV